MRARTKPRLDPYAILAALEQERTIYIVIGAFVCVLHGSDEMTPGSTSPRRRGRRTSAGSTLRSRRTTPVWGDGRAAELERTDFVREPVVELVSDYGQVKVVPFPADTRGYDDLRRAATREPIGRGLRPSVASPGDLARMLSAFGREQDIPQLLMMRRLIELGRERTRGLYIER